MKFTGKDLYEAARPLIVRHGYEDLEWEDCVPLAQEFYIEQAEQLNKNRIAPLQEQIAALRGLVRDYRALIEDEDLMIEDSSDGWWTKRERALSLANQLIGEEEKSAK